MAYMNMNLELLWNDIPIGKDNAIDYMSLRIRWGCSERTVRRILHELSYVDTGDDYILIRSSQGKGFYRTKDIKEIELYRKEVTNRAKHTFAPLKKIRRVLADKK